jgi:hypothetical protein
MRFNFFGKKSICDKCGKKFKNEAELMGHNHTAHAIRFGFTHTKINEHCHKGIVDVS